MSDATLGAGADTIAQEKKILPAGAERISKVLGDLESYCGMPPSHFPRHLAGGARDAVDKV